MVVGVLNGEDVCVRSVLMVQNSAVLCGVLVMIVSFRVLCNDHHEHSLIMKK